MSDYSRNIVLNTLQILQNNNMRRDKVMLHKFLFFQDFMGSPTGFRFEPYTYGPFSFDLANTLDFMKISGAIKVDEQGNYEAKEHGSQDPAVEIVELFQIFKKAIGNVFTFDALECVGTLLYCVKALRGLSKDINDQSIISEFKGWKGSKYPEPLLLNHLADLRSAHVI